MFMVFKKYKNQSSKLDLKTTIFLMLSSDHPFFSSPRPTYRQQPDVESPLDGGLSAASHLWIFHFPAQQIFSHPFFPKLLIILCFCLSTHIFHQDLSFFFHDINVFFPPHPSDGLTSLFKDWEWIVHTRLEPQQFSDREGLRDSSLVCVCANVQFQFWT